MRKKILFEKKWKTISGGVGLAILPAVFILALGRAPDNLLFLGSRETKQQEEFEDRFTSGVITARNCFAFSDLAKAVDGCVEVTDINQKSPKSLWLIGDSHAMSMLNGLRRVAKKEKATLRVIGRSGTAFPLPRNYIKLRSSGIEGDKLSSSFMNELRTELLRRIRKGDIVIVGLRFSYHFGPDTYENKEKDFTYISDDGNVVSGHKKKFFTDWLKELDKLSLLLKSKEASIIVLGPVPEWESGNARCDKQWFNRNNDCTESRADQELFYRENLQDLRRLSQQHSNLYVFDTNKVLCPLDICRFQDRNGKNLYWDDDHISDYAAIELVAPSIWRFIDSEISRRQFE